MNVSIEKKIKVKTEWILEICFVIVSEFKREIAS